MLWCQGVQNIGLSNRKVKSALKVDHPRVCVFSDARMNVCSCNLDLDPLTLIYELDLDILKTAKNEVSGSRLAKFSPNRTDRHDRTHYHAVFADGKYQSINLQYNNAMHGIGQI